MYFLRYQPLKEKLRTRTLSDREALPYLIAYSAFYSVFWLIPGIENPTSWDYLSAGASVVLAILAVIYFYIKNGKSEGFDLVLKFLTIGWIVGVRFVLAMLLVLGLMLLVLPIIDTETDFLFGEESTGWLDSLVIAVIEIIFYQRIGHHIADTK
jgi:membrane protease YdiL (CAAX protease family)